MSNRQGVRIEGTWLRSRLARRIFLMFCAMAFIPGAVVFWLTWQQANRAIDTSEQRSLRAETRSVAFTLLARLQSAEVALGRIAGPGPMPTGAATGVFDAIDVRPLRAGLAGDAARLEILEDPSSASGVHRVVLLVPRTEPDGTSSLVAGTVSPGYLWHPDEDAVEGTRVCVRAGTRSLGCAGAVADAVPLSRDAWQLEMHEFDAAPWQFEAEREAAAPQGLSVHWFALLAVGVLLMAMLMSLVQIRRTLVPLEALMDRMRLFSGLQGPASHEAPDELDALSRTFEDMRRRIGGQLGRLRALSAVDADIVSREPLERVLAGVARQLRALPGVKDAVITVDAQGAEPPGHHGTTVGNPPLDCAFDAPCAPGQQGRPGASANDWEPVAVPGCDTAPGAHRAYGRRVGTPGAPQARVVLVAGEEGPDAETLEAGAQLSDRVAIALALDARERTLLHQSRHDLLTGLPNRLAAVEALDAAIAGSPTPFAVVFLDLDRFKAVNDGLGHALGDSLLVEVSRRLRAVLAPEDVVARFGGDEFVLLLRGVAAQAGLDAVRARIDEAFAPPVVLDDHVMAIRYSAGVAFHPIDGNLAHELVRKADVAMYRAKQQGGGGFAAYSDGMNEAARDEVALVAALRTALATDALDVHYQPRIRARDAGWAGMEALVRWFDPQRGWVPPARFVPLAERHGLIDALGMFVLRTACRQVAAWRADGLDPGRLAVNVSSQQMRAGTLAEDFGRVVHDTGVRWSDLEVEITESLLITDADAGSRQLQALRDLGVSVAIDDFGTGYSSLAYLARLPLDIIKIDRAFVVALDEPGTAPVVRSILALASMLGKQVVTEGVETRAQLLRLQAWGCDVFQGYLFHRPMPAADVQALLVDRQRAGEG